MDAPEAEAKEETPDAANVGDEQVEIVLADLDGRRKYTVPMQQRGLRGQHYL